MKTALLFGFLFVAAVAMPAGAAQGTVSRGSLEGTVRDRQTR